MTHDSLLLFEDYVPFWDGLQTACGISWDENDVARFMRMLRRVENPKSPVGVCYEFTGAKSRGRGNTAWYGTFKVKRKAIRAHKFSAVAILGLRPEKHLHHIDHECRNSRCVSCLQLLTGQENLKLRWQRVADRGYE